MVNSKDLKGGSVYRGIHLDRLRKTMEAGKADDGPDVHT